jgi:hypothetical protein
MIVGIMIAIFIGSVLIVRRRRRAHRPVGGSQKDAEGKTPRFFPHLKRLTKC